MAVEAFNPLAIANTLAEMEFRNLSAFNEGAVGVFWSEAGGPGPWEMHPHCEELLHVMEGRSEIEILPINGGPGEKTVVGPGEYLVVPRLCWHRHLMLERTREMYLTPGATQTSQKVDPRQ